MARPRIFTQEQVIYAAKLRSQGLSLNQVTKIVAGNSGGGTRSSLARALEAYGFLIDPPYKLIYKPRDFSHIERDWWNEFRGLFFGEGSIYITKPSKEGGSFLQPRLSISLREDDGDVVREIHSKLGGNLVNYTRKVYVNRINNPQVSWQVVGIPVIYAMLPYLMNAVFPSKKLRELALVKEYCEARMDMPMKLTVEQKAELTPYYHKLKEFKVYTSC